MATESRRTHDHILSRKNVRFHDGTVFDAEAVKASYERQYLRTSPYYTSAPSNAYERVVADLIKEVRIVDSHTVAITTHYARPQQFAIVKIVSPKALTTQNGNLSRTPVGTGPFRLAKWEGNNITLEAFAESWHGRPRIGNVRFVIFDSEIEMMDRVIAGDFDLCTYVTPDYLERLANNPNTKVTRYGGLNTMILGMLMDRPLIKDPRVREAIVRATDREGYATKLGRGAALAAKSVLPPASDGYDASLSQAPYDPERARVLLRNAGVPSGSRLRLLYFSPQELWTELAHAVRSDLEKVGLQIELVPTKGWSDFHAERRKGAHDLHLYQWLVSTPDPERFLAPMFDSQSKDNNYSRLVSPRIDQALAESRKAGDPGKRLQILSQVNSLVLEEIPAVFLMHRVGLAGVNTRVQGLTLNLYGLPQDKLATVEIR